MVDEHDTQRLCFIASGLGEVRQRDEDARRTRQAFPKEGARERPDLVNPDEVRRPTLALNDGAVATQ